MGKFPGKSSQPNSEVESGQKNSDPSLSKPVPTLLDEISGNLLMLAKVADQLSQVPPDQLSKLLDDRRDEIDALLNQFGVSAEDFDGNHLLN